MPDRLFDRDFVLQIGGLRLASRLLDSTRRELGEGVEDEALTVEFNITKTLRRSANKCELTIHNLNKENRIALQDKGQQVVLEAGYIDSTSIIFDGILENTVSVRGARVGWTTRLEVSDGSKKIKSKRINTSLKGPAKASDVLRIAADAMGLKPGNLESAIARGSQRGNLSEFTNGIVLSGKADRVLDNIARSMGYSYSIQDGQLILLAKNDFLGTTPPLISPATGMVGSPEPGDKGFINVRSLIQPNLGPGSRIEVASREVNGFFRIQKVNYRGNSRRGPDWYADMECKPLGEAS